LTAGVRSERILTQGVRTVGDDRASLPEVAASQSSCNARGLPVPRCAAASTHTGDAHPLQRSTGTPQFLVRASGCNRACPCVPPHRKSQLLEDGSAEGEGGQT